METKDFGSLDQVVHSDGKFYTLSCISTGDGHLQWTRCKIIRI